MAPASTRAMSSASASAVTPALVDANAGFLQPARQLAGHPVGGGLRIARPRGHLLEEPRAGGRDGHLARVVLREPVRRDEPPAPGVGKLRQAGPHRLDPLRRDRERRQVGLGEVPVVVRLFLAAHDGGAPGGDVAQPRLADDAPAAVEHGRLPRDLVVEGPFEVAERVEVLDLDRRAERRRRRAGGATRSRRSAGALPRGCRRSRRARPGWRAAARRTRRPRPRSAGRDG